MPQRPNRGNNATLTPPEINSVAFQAAMSVAVTATLVQIRNGNNEEGSGQRAGSTNQGTNHKATRPCTYKDFTNAKPRTFNGTGGVIALKRWIEKVEYVFEICGCPDECKVKFAACTFIDQALSWWNGHVEAMTLPVVNAMPWEELNEMMLAEYFPRGEIHKMEQELWNLMVQNSNIDAYISQFSDLSLLCPGMITSEEKKIERFIWGLNEPIQGNVIATNPKTFDSAKRLAKKWYDHGNKKGAKTVGVEVKKEEENKKGKNNKRKGKQNSELSKKQQTMSFHAVTQATATPHAPASFTPNASKQYSGNLPKCNKCNFHHHGECREMSCARCNQKDHTTKYSRTQLQHNQTTNNNNNKNKNNTNTGAIYTCYECGKTGHIRRNCPNANNQVTRAIGRVLTMG
ncbi:uncharacterized protein LOC111880458 [Lactuca sativa]|uniref:uncharacterized protein LOC111880458 n=1 Tax=Lactuca sativa TaxID=4236 RepID=UPI000CD8B9CB|nr:uncharacterized protein LOC111880458 [Lactuca sativa]